MEIEFYLVLVLVVDTYEVLVNQLVVLMFASSKLDQEMLLVKQRQKMEN
jgi:hypothetical protein